MTLQSLSNCLLFLLSPEQSGFVFRLEALIEDAKICSGSE